MAWARAIHFAIITDRQTGAIVRIFNPTFEFELDLHHVAAHERVLRLRKSEHGIARCHDGMTVADAARLLEQYGGRT